MTLYNIDLKGKFSPLWESAISDLIENEVLVPVEPDYEAAAIETGLWAKGMKDFARDYARRVVDAALGIGDTE